MDAFWGPLIIYGCILVVGLIVCAVGAGMTDGENVDRETEKLGNGIAMFGLSIMAMGAVPAVVHLVGNCIDKCHKLL